MSFNAPCSSYSVCSVFFLCIMSCRAGPVMVYLSLSSAIFYSVCHVSVSVPSYQYLAVCHIETFSMFLMSVLSYHYLFVCQVLHIHYLSVCWCSREDRRARGMYPWTPPSSTGGSIPASAHLQHHVTSQSCHMQLFPSDISTSQHGGSLTFQCRPYPCCYSVLISLHIFSCHVLFTLTNRAARA